MSRIQEIATRFSVSKGDASDIIDICIDGCLSEEFAHLCETLDPESARRAINAIAKDVIWTVVESQFQTEEYAEG